MSEKVTVEIIDKDKARITKGILSTEVKIFIMPIGRGRIAFAYRLQDETPMIVTEPYIDSGDETGAIPCEGSIGTYEDLEAYWAGCKVPNLPNNDHVPFWAVEAFMSI